MTSNSLDCDRRAMISCANRCPMMLWPLWPLDTLNGTTAIAGTMRAPAQGPVLGLAWGLAWGPAWGLAWGPAWGLAWRPCRDVVASESKVRWARAGSPGRRVSC